MKSILKGYIYSLIFLSLALSIISIFILLTKINLDVNIIGLILGIGSFGISAFYIGNYYQKYGLMIGLLWGIVNIFIVACVYILLDLNFETNYILKLSIYLLSSTIFSILGVNVKKIL